MLNEKTVRTTKEIKESLLRRAWNGTSAHSPAEMILLIQWICSRSKDISENHKDILKAIDPTQPRSVMMLNAIMAELGLKERYMNTAGKSVIIPDRMTLQ